LYDYIKGYVTRVTPEYVVLEQSGIGWQVMTPNPFAFHITDEVQQVFTYLHVREDTQLLIGFKTLEQRELFRKLITVSGIGPKGALAILANGLPSQVVSAIEREDEGFLVQFPGVGKKTARQMILDLKGKLHDLFTEIDLPDNPVQVTVKLGQNFPVTSASFGKCLFIENKAFLTLSFSITSL